MLLVRNLKTMKVVGLYWVNVSESSGAVPHRAVSDKAALNCCA